MRFAKRMLMATGAVALAGILGAMMSPKIAHAVSALVTVANTSANPVPATLPTHLGVPAANLVTLSCGFSGGSCSSWEQILPDGTSQAFALNGSLIITDINWVASHGTPGNSMEVDLIAHGGAYLILDPRLVRADFLAGGSVHLTGGVVVTSMPFATLFGSATGVGTLVMNGHTF